MNGLHQIARLWRRKSRKAERHYLVGRINANLRILLVQNERREQQTDGDYLLFVGAVDPAQAEAVAEFVANVNRWQPSDNWFTTKEAK